MKAHIKEIYVNLPVNDLQKSITFFTKLGFSFNQQFTNKNGTCMIIGKNIYAMLLAKKFFKTFTKKELVNAKKSTEVILALSVGSRKNVDELVKKAIKAGGSLSMKPQDHGWMYSQSFADIDGHHWELFYMDEKALKKLSRK